VQNPFDLFFLLCILKGLNFRVSGHNFEVKVRARETSFQAGLILLGHVCFLEFTFRETTLQTFLCLFAIRKVGQWKTLFGQRRTLSSQRKTLSGQRKTLSSQRKIWFSFQESVFPLAVFVFRKVVSGKPLSKLSCVCLSLEKLVNGKHFPVKGKFGLVFRKVFSWKIWAENTFRKL
jgi:hypothetical protein